MRGMRKAQVVRFGQQSEMRREPIRSQVNAFFRNSPRSGNAAAPATFAGMSLIHARSWLTEVGVATARAAAFMLYLIYGLCWVTLGNGLEWHSMATLATWGMTLLVQRAAHRDTQAMPSSTSVHGEAKDSLMKIDDQDAEEVERERARMRGTRT